MAEVIDEIRSLESSTIGIYRTAAVVKGGRRFSWSAMVAVGDRQGNVGVGYGKAGSVPQAIEKAQKSAKKKMQNVTLKEGTIPHAVMGKFGASSVKLIPAAPGAGVIAGGTVRAVLELAGVRDCLTKAYGSTNQKNLCKAAIEGLMALRSKEQVAAIRGVEIAATEVEERLAYGEKFAPRVRAAVVKPARPAASEGTEKGKGKGGGKGKGKKRQEEGAGEGGEVLEAGSAKGESGSVPGEQAAVEPKGSEPTGEPSGG